MMLAPFRGRWALVTGAGDGIGKALAIGAAREGVNVALCDIREDAAAGVAAEAGAHGVETRVVLADVSDRDAVFAAAGALRDAGVTPTLLFANAGVAAAAGIVDAPPRLIEWLLHVNVLGVAWTAQAFVPAMRDADGPKHVCITASVASVIDVRGPYPLYAASKHATAGIAEALEVELPPQGIGVTILYPGTLNTGIWDAARARPARFGGERRQPYETGERWRAAMSPETVVQPTFAAIARGGGRVIVDSAGDARDLFAARTDAMRAAFQAP